MIKECKKHGFTSFSEGKRPRCRKCLVISVKKRRDKIKKDAIQYKGGKCQNCGYDKCLGALEFHHLDPKEKDFSISQYGHTRSWEKLKTELDKCTLLCANCHREIHEKIRLVGENGYHV